MANEKNKDVEEKKIELPQNIEAEQALIGAILINNKIFEKISEFLKDYHFADSIHGKIYTVCSKLINRGHVADPITLKDYFSQSGELEEIGGHKYLFELTEKSSPAINAEYYGQIIQDKFIRRQLIDVGYEVVNDACVDDLDSNAFDQIEAAEKHLFEIANESETGSGPQDFATALTASLENIEMAYQKDGNISGVSTGLTDLDGKLGGLNKSDLLILAGRPAMGKTALATNIAFNVADILSKDETAKPKDKGVAFFSLEMSADQLATRILSTQTQIGSHKMRTGNLEATEFTRLAAAVRELEQVPLYIDDTPGLTVSAIRTRCRRLKRNKGLGCVIIDYIQLIEGSGSSRSSGNRVQEVSEISRGLKMLAKELQVPVIALSQLSRSVESRDDKRPMLSDLRESGSIEQDADIVMFVYRESYYLKNSEPQPKPSEGPDKYQQRLEDWEKRWREKEFVGEVIIEKQRHGPTGAVELYFNGEFTEFSNLQKSSYTPEQFG